MNVYGYIFGFLLDRWFYVIVVVILPDKWFCDFFMLTITTGELKQLLCHDHYSSLQITQPVLDLHHPLV